MSVKIYDQTLESFKDADGLKIYKNGVWTNAEGMICKNGTWEKVFPDGSVEIVPFSTGTDEQLAAMLDAHYAGNIDIHDYWSVGDERTVSLSAMNAQYVWESQPAQNVTMVLMAGNGYKTLENGNPAAFIVGQKGLLSNAGIMHTSASNNIGWKISSRRSWCNDIYYNALPSGFKSLVKPFVNYACPQYGSTLDQVIDYISLPASSEIAGVPYNPKIMNEGNIFAYYNTSSNRIKSGASVKYYWTRSGAFRVSTSSNWSYCFDKISCTSGVQYLYNGSPTYDATTDYGISPFCCI